MFLKETKSILTAALQNTFTGAYPVADFQNIFISIEYPYERQNYPAIWVGFEPMGTIDRGGINNDFGFTPAQFFSDGSPLPISVWRATGYATYTIGALTALERDNLFDELLRVLAFSDSSSAISYRSMVESNPLIGMNLNFDAIAVRGISENPGTPWGTSEIIYEATLAIEAQIEFSSDLTGTLTSISEVTVNADNPVSGDLSITVT